MNKSKKTFELVIIIPCYNEAQRLLSNKVKAFLPAYNNVCLVFVDDGSIDNTKEKLLELEEECNGGVKTLLLKRNSGKAEAVRQGVQFALMHLSFSKIAYLDADFSTSLQECYEISQQINRNICFVFGSRIAKIDTEIERKAFRFLVGRFIATLISMQLHIKVYDTQCGCKVFTEEIAKNVFQESFISRWLFDVEIFHRIAHLKGLKNMKHIAREYPLKQWIDTDDSRVKFTYLFKLGYDLLTIRNKYKIST